ncbi:hypothetical protein [Nonomuraea harbinensis]|uniref:Uncharacterized protein n=1 Tax=Nonomuraea harbinensis TaxID=1286938 RepID=A0ABW1BQ12_9ACTN|nr:hypothetical protein [Nonomuraea harbinensis]
MHESAKMVIMRANRRDEVLDDLAAAIQALSIPDGPAIRRAFVEHYVDSEGEPALRALVILGSAGDDGWSARFTHELRKRVNQLAVEHDLDEYVYVTPLTEEDFAARDQPEETQGAPDTRAIDEVMNHPDQDGS